MCKGINLESLEELSSSVGRPLWIYPLLSSNFQENINSYLEVFDE
jgi:hypothetical protein